MKPSIGGPLENHAVRIAALEAELAALKRLIKSSGLSSVATDDTLSGDGTPADPLSASGLSGSIDSAIHSLSGSVDSAIHTLTSGGLSFVTTDGTLEGDGTAGDPLSAAGLSGTLDSRFLNLTGSLISGLSETYSSLQTGVTASIAGLSGTINARFLNITGSLISSVSNVYNSLAAGISGSITGTTNTVPKFTSAHALGNSTISDDGSAVSVSNDLHVAGSVTGSGDARFNRNLLVLSKVQVNGVNWDSNIHWDGDGNQSSYLRAGKTAGAVHIGDVNTGGVNIGASNNATSIDGDASVEGSLTGSGQSLFSTALFSNPWPSGSGVRTVVTLDDSSGAKRAGDGQRLRFTFGSFNYNAWVAAVTTRANPDFLNPRLEFAVQQPFTTGLGNVTASLIVYGESVEVTGSARVNGSLTGSGVGLFQRNGGSGVGASLAGTTLELDSDGDSYLTIKGKSSNVKGIEFANGYSTFDGAILYDQPTSNPRGIDFRTGGNNTRVRIDQSGTLTAMKDVVVSGSLTGSGDALFSRNMLIAGNTTFDGYLRGLGDDTFFLMKDDTVGFVKKSGFQPKLAHGNGVPFVIAMANNSASLVNVAGTTFTDRFTIATDGGVTIARSLTGSDGVLVQGSLTGSGDGKFNRDFSVGRDLTVVGAASLGSSMGLVHSISGNVIHNDDGSGCYLLTSTPVSRTVSLASVFSARAFGTFDTTSGDLISQVGEFRAESTTTGSNLLTNRALRLNASGGDVNQALVTAAGDVILNSTNGTTFCDSDVVLGSSNADSISFKGKSVTDLDLNSHRIVNLTDPSTAQDAATKAYVDSLSGSAASGIAALSATINARFLNVTGSMISSFSKLSGTINARFLNITGSLISGLSETYSSLQTGVTASIADLSGTIDAQRVSDGIDPVRSMQVFDEYLFTSLSTNSANAIYTTLAGSGAGWIFLPVITATKDIEYSQVGQLGWLPHPQGIRLKYDAWAALNNVSTSTEQSRTTLGFCDVKNGTQANGFFWENDRSVHGNTNWWLVAVNSSTRSQLDTGLTGNVDPHHFSLELNEACTAVTGMFDGKTPIILTGSGIPNSFNPIAPLAQIFKTAGSAQHALWVDYQWGRGLTSGSSARR